ncbi:hypothetical protein [Sphingopyxis sp. PET50]|uniref:hypothetical protein n=1 Tax=Sphingopyxis sp. PET50 TaxID=2976533 RepID=UPI0021B03F24|nr:hypothetical protein [Sphingopyxis sp. PET50]
MPFGLADPRHQVAPVDRERRVERGKFGQIVAKRPPGRGEIALKRPRMRIGGDRGSEMTGGRGGIAARERGQTGAVGLDSGDGRRGGGHGPCLPSAGAIGKVVR